MLRFMLLFYVLTLSGSLWAQDLVSIFQLAQQEDSTYQVAVAQRELGREDAKRAGLVYGPGVYVERGRAAFETTDRTTVQVVQPVVDVEKWATFREVTLREREAEVEFQHQDVELAHKIYERISKWIEIQALITLQEQEAQALDSQVQRSKRRFELGWGTVLDVSNATIQHTQSLAKLQTLQGELMAARQQLQAMLRQPLVDMQLTPDYDLAAIFELEPAIEDVPVNLPPAVLQAQVDVEVAQGQLDKAQWYWLPQVNLVLRASEHAGRQDKYAGFQINMPTGVSAFSRSAQQRAQLALKQAQAVLQDEQVQMRLRVQASAFALKASVREMALRSEAVRMSDVTVKATERAYEAGVGEAQAVVAAILSGFEAKRQRLRLHMNLAQHGLAVQMQAGVGAEVALARMQALFKSGS